MNTPSFDEPSRYCDVWWWRLETFITMKFPLFFKVRKKSMAMLPGGRSYTYFWAPREIVQNDFSFSYHFLLCSIFPALLCFPSEIYTEFVFLIQLFNFVSSWNMIRFRVAPYHFTGFVQGRKTFWLKLIRFWDFTLCEQPKYPIFIN